MNGAGRTRIAARRRGAAPFLALLALAATAAPAQESAVPLPPFLVEEAAKGPPWRHGEAMGFEILSRCGDAATRRVVEAHFQLHQLLGEMLPPSLRWQSAVPPLLILYDEELQPAASQEVIRQLLRRADAPEPDFGAMPGGRGLRMPSAAPRYSFLPNLRLWDRDGMAIFMIVRRDQIDADRLSLTYDYVNFLVRQRLPVLPAWFVGGMLTLYQKTEYGSGQLTVPAVEWFAPVPAEAQLKDPAFPPPVWSLPEVLHQRLPASGGPGLPAGVDPAKAWQAHAALLVRWGLDADQQAHRAGLWRFVERSASEGTGEELFKECLGFGYDEARRRLAAYLPVAARRSLRLKPVRPAKLPPFPLVNASDLQIACIKGDWERLEVPYVRGISAELAPKYLDQARRTLRRAYDRDHRDPRLLAVMGLCEVDGGDDAAARGFLESAAALGPIRPRASQELGRLRLAEACANPAGAGGRIDTNQTARVLEALFAARAAAPPLPEVYELVARAWMASEARPTLRHLAVLDEGVKLFPRRIPLVRLAAELYAREGHREQAEAFIELGLRVAEDEPTRAIFGALRSRP